MLRSRAFCMCGWERSVARAAKLGNYASAHGKNSIHGRSVDAIGAISDSVSLIKTDVFERAGIKVAVAVGGRLEGRDMFFLYSDCMPGLKTVVGIIRVVSDVAEKAGAKCPKPVGRPEVTKGRRSVDAAGGAPRLSGSQIPEGLMDVLAGKGRHSVIDPMIIDLICLGCPLAA